MLTLQTVSYSRGVYTRTIYMRNVEITVRNQMVRDMPFGKLQKIWAVI